MEYRNICLGCMGDKGQAELCPHCGYIEGTEPPSGQYLLPGTMLAGKYLIGKGLGHGGFGITYLAYDTVLKRKLAIKEYLPQDCATRAPGQSEVMPFSGEDKQEQFIYGVDKFLEEARTLAQFDGHPNIVGVRDFFKANGTAYLVMNFLNGETLKEYLRRHDRALGYQQALKIMLPVMDALRTVHAAGVLHRDVSPDNIFLTNSGQVKLIDFGAARQPMSGQRSISVILKPGYAPEEQYRSRGKQGPWTDVYATAATFYRAITGKVPPESLDRMDQDTLISPSKLGVRIPPEAEAALLRAMAVRAVERYQTIQEFKDALSAGLPPAQHPGPAGPAQRQQPRIDLPERRTRPPQPPQRPSGRYAPPYEDPATYPLRHNRGKGVRVGIVVALLIVLVVVALVLGILYWLGGLIDEGQQATTPPMQTASAAPTAEAPTPSPTVGEEEPIQTPEPQATPLPANMMEGAKPSKPIASYAPASGRIIKWMQGGRERARLTGTIGGTGVIVCEAELDDAGRPIDHMPDVYYTDQNDNVRFSKLDQQESGAIFLPYGLSVGQAWTLSGKVQEVVAVDYQATLNGVAYTDCIVIKEGENTYKFYVPGIGLHTIRPSLEQDADASYYVTDVQGTSINLFDILDAVG